jgi:hypothetical protein
LWWITDLINYRIQQQRANQNAAFVGECEKYKIPGLACRPTILPSLGLQWRKSWWGRGATTPPPPPSRKMPNFWKFSPKRGLKTAFSSSNREVCWKFESFVGNLEGFAPPPLTGKSEFPPLGLHAGYTAPSKCIQLYHFILSITRWFYLSRASCSKAG